MSDTAEPHEVAEVAVEHHLAGRHHAALGTLRPYFATGKLDPAEARDFVRHALNVSRVLREMGLAETAANLWAAILPGLAGGKSIDRPHWILLGAEACEAAHEGGRSVSRLADIVEQDAVDAPAGAAQRFLRAAEHQRRSPRPASTAGATTAERSRRAPERSLSVRQTSPWRRSAAAHC